ncbi:MAG TPA: hypothetical protein VNU01_03450 [Egibacteraceae bacterium]|nr:hypothetical protein [Egibacteraceae bacterium]
MDRGDAGGDDGLDALRRFRRTAAGFLVFLALAFASLVVAHGVDEARFSACLGMRDGPAGASIRPDLHVLPPSVDCHLTWQDGREQVRRVALDPIVPAAVAGVVAAWAALAGAAVYAATRGGGAAMLDRAAATLGSGVLVGAVAVALVASIAHQDGAFAPVPRRGIWTPLQAGWVAPAVLVSVASASFTAAVRARSRPWIAGVAAAVVLWLFLVVGAFVHPATPRIGAALTAGVAGSVLGRVARAVRGRPA